MVDQLNLIAYASDDELRAAYRFARRCNQWRVCHMIKTELATR